jgi:hypothetical protein
MIQDISPYAKEHRGSAGPYQRRGILQGVFGEAGEIVGYIMAQKAGIFGV